MLVCAFACTYILLLMSHKEAEAPSVGEVPRLVSRTDQSPLQGFYSLL